MIQAKLLLPDGTEAKIVPGTRVRFIRDEGTCAVYIPKGNGSFVAARFGGTIHEDDKLLMKGKLKTKTDDFSVMLLVSALSGLCFEPVTKHSYGGNSSVYELVAPPN